MRIIIPSFVSKYRRTLFTCVHMVGLGAITEHKGAPVNGYLNKYGWLGDNLRESTAR